MISNNQACKNIFAIRPGTSLTWHAACLGRQKRENNMFQCNKITEQVSSQLLLLLLLNEDVTYEWKLAGVIVCLRLT